jgi:hypothetical protein
MVGEQCNSILAADVGSQWTKVLLLERVEGVFRFITRGRAPTSLAGPTEADGILAGLRAAIRQIEQITGRVLLRGDDLITPEDSDGNGADSVAATTSAAQNLRLVIVGLVEGSGLEAAREAARTTYCDVQSTVTANGGLPHGLPRRWFGTGEGGLASLRQALSTRPPDVVVLIGGSDGGSVLPLAELARTIAESGFATAAGRSVIFAGNSGAQAEVARSLTSAAGLRVVDNIAPTRNVTNPEPLAGELDSAFRERKLSTVPGRAALEAWAVRPMETGAAGFWLVLRFLAQQYGLRVLGVDVGARTTLMGLATQSGLARSVWPGLGTGESSAYLLDKVGAAAIARWAPFPCSEDHLREFVSRRLDQPLATPDTFEQSWLELAFVREALRALPPPATADLILGCGGALGHVRRPGQAALALLDGLQPCGVCQLTLDSSGAVSALGAVALTQPDAAAQVLLGDALLPLGTAICPSGSGRRGKTALTVRVRSLDSGGMGQGSAQETDSASEVCAEVPFGQLAVIPTMPGKRIRLQLRPARGFDVGLGSGAAAALDLTPQGLGIIVDCRGRPFAPPAEPDERLLAVQDWNRALGAMD